jgi:hypothetical protein
MARRILGTFAGIIVAMLVVGVMDYLSRMLVPDAASMPAQGFAAVPMTAKVVMALGWLLATLIGGFIAVRIARWVPAVWVVAGLIIAACLYNGFTIPGVPFWMQVAGVIAPLLGGLIVRSVAKPA